MTDKLSGSTRSSGSSGGSGSTDGGDSSSRLKNTESALTFLQQEHKSVLGGLHEEVRRLQQKCSELQFSLTTAQGAARESSSLRLQLQSLQQDNELKVRRLDQLEETLRSRTDRLEEVQSQLRWSELQWRNEIDSQAVRIEQLLLQQQSPPPPAPCPSQSPSISPQQQKPPTPKQQLIKTRSVFLPLDYRSSVSKLPPIAATASGGGGNRSHRVVATHTTPACCGGDDGGVLVTTRSGGIISRRSRSSSVVEERIDLSSSSSVEVSVLAQVSPTSRKNSKRQDGKKSVVAAVAGEGRM